MAYISFRICDINPQNHISQNSNRLYQNIITIKNMKNSITHLLLAFYFILVVQSADTILRESVAGNTISMSANGNTIVVLYFAPSSQLSSQFTVFKKVAATYHKIKIKDVTVFAQLPSQNRQRPRLTDDGKYMYFINGATGLVTKASLANTSIVNPHIQLISINEYLSRQNSPFLSKFAVAGNYVAIYSQSTKVLTIVQNDSILVFNQSMTTLNSSYSNQILSYQITSIQFARDARTMILRIDYLRHLHQFYLYFGGNQFAYVAYRYDQEPQLFPQGYYQFITQQASNNNNNNKNGYTWSTVSELTLQKNYGIKVRRLYDKLYLLEGSKDKRTTQGYSLGWNGQYAIQLIQADNQTISDPDLKIVEERPFGNFELNLDGSIVAYQYEGTLVMIQQQLGVAETVYPCYNARLYLKYYDKCADQKSIVLFSFATSIILLIFNVTVFTILIVLYLKRKAKNRQDEENRQQNANEGQTNVAINQHGECTACQQCKKAKQTISAIT